jgi:hypothetical protein
MTIQNITTIIKQQLAIIDLIPNDFEPVETPTGIDRDELETIFSEIEHNCLDMTNEACLAELKSTSFTLSEYITLFSNEIKKLKFLQYTTPASVHCIMDSIGTEGVLNTDKGLCIYSSDNDLKLDKTDFLVISPTRNYSITNEQKTSYNTFLTYIS